ncbi:Exosome complex component RRP40 [Cyphellophora attinorum]|uniref:Exosome complex component RRP40 n=1 Tax=Cyphellophora attinorum TaxID=1664694 RepID=A0A0N1HZ18_9EURO|nr:Exosome complex component RRP40 [Phialophora attinorum]KPI43887.1 Exosome complex component RRP40 [Phialophora attinorum]
MATAQIFLPGDLIPASLLPPPHKKRKLGPGIRLQQHQDPSTITTTTTVSETFTSTLAGPLTINPQKRTATIIPHPNTTRYNPKLNDLVIAQITRTTQDFYHVSLSPHGATAILAQLNFEGATKKTRPKLESGDLVYARVVFVGAEGAGMEVEVSCVDAQTGKAGGEGLGVLGGASGGGGVGTPAVVSTGMVFDVSVGLAERILRKEEGIEFLAELGGKLEGGFEVCVGRNGRVWVDGGEGSSGVRGTCAVGRCLREVDERYRRGEGWMDAKAQKKMVSRILGEFGLG